MYEFDSMLFKVLSQAFVSFINNERNLVQNLLESSSLANCVVAEELIEYGIAHKIKLSLHFLKIGLR